MTEVQQPKRGRPPGHGVGMYPLNQKRKAFVRLVSAGADPTAAVAEAGYKTTAPRRMAQRLMNLALIRAAIKKAGAQKTELLQQLDAAKQLAIATSDAGALVAAISAKCRILGLL
jgi:hypothetical protein